MASPHHHHHHHAHSTTAPLSVTTVSFSHTLSHPADTSCPPSPTAIAAATTLATLADARPLPATSAQDEHASSHHYDDSDLDDDDDSGGISITPADLQEYISLSALADASMTEQDIVEQLESIMAQSPSHSHAIPAASSNSSYHIPSIFEPIPHFSIGHVSSSDLVLEPLPPTLQEAYLSVEDNGSFTPITSFFDRIAPQRPTVPGLDLVKVPAAITRDHLQGDRFDAQGIDWLVRNTSRAYVRARRAESEASQLPLKFHQLRRSLKPVPSSDNYFRFSRNNTTHRAFFPHFQLRNVLAATSRNDIYYAAGHHVFRTDAAGSLPDVMIDFSNRLSIKGSITTIASTGNVLIAGAFDGEYAITNLASTYEAPCVFGRTTDISMDTRSRIVNHLHLFEGRTTYYPQAVLCSNDYHLRVLDCATNQFTQSFLYPAAVNCSATSPNGRMRVVVGDFLETLITNAETGQPFETLNSHTDDAFACAWADDGIHVATAAQDSTIVIWDARDWSKPLKTLPSQLGVTRSLRFSPVGSGPRVLVAAEADDYINVINAQTFDSKQTFDFFGPIGGVTFTPDGQSLFIANGERRFGGIIELERTGWAERSANPRCDYDPDWDDLMTDWAYDNQLDNHDGALSGDIERERRCVDFASLVV